MLITAPPTRGMAPQERDGLKEALGAEKGKDVAARILAVHYVRDLDIAPELAAEMVFSSASAKSRIFAQGAPSHTTPSAVGGRALERCGGEEGGTARRQS